MNITREMLQNFTNVIKGNYVKHTHSNKGVDVWIKLKT
jgi:hypothetical protein